MLGFDAIADNALCAVPASADMLGGLLGFGPLGGLPLADAPPAGGSTPIPPDTRPIWGTFPNWKRLPEWWPSRQKKIEQELEEKVEEIVEPLPAKAKEIIRELSLKVAREREDVSELRKAVQAKLAAEKVRFSAAAKDAVAKVEMASIKSAAQIAAEQRAAEEEQTRLRKEKRNRDAMRIIQMLQ